MRPGFGTSSGTNSKLVVPRWKPSGRADWVSSQARCSARLANVSEVDGMAAFRRSGARRQRAGRPAGGRPRRRPRLRCDGAADRVLTVHAPPRGRDLRRHRDALPARPARPRLAALGSRRSTSTPGSRASCATRSRSTRAGRSARSGRSPPARSRCSSRSEASLSTAAGSTRSWTVSASTWRLTSRPRSAGSRMRASPSRRSRTAA